MNDFANTTNSAGLLKPNYDPVSDQTDALRRRQNKLEKKVQLANPNPKLSDFEPEDETK